jgi:fibronectin type 3 domain-containing protein
MPPPPAAGGRMPTPLNPAPLPAPPFVDGRVAFGKPRCYAVRAVTMFGAQSIEGDASPAQCISPMDTFAPAAPVSLKAIGTEGAISLIWEANKETDLAGYLVLRATLPGTDFKQLTPEPIRDTTFHDTTVARGVRYAYVVLAVDASNNRSAPSNRVEESAR